MATVPALDALRAQSRDGGSGWKSPLDAPVVRARSPLVLGAIGAAAIHAALVVGMNLQGPRAARRYVARPQPTLEAELIREAPPEPPKEAPPPPAAPPPAPPPAAKPARVARSVPAPAPVAAAAAQVLAKSEPEVVDFGETFVQGQAATYAGGVTQAGGTAQHAVRETAARADGVEGGKGIAPVDHSREASLADGTRWDCPFPEEADDEGLDHGIVTLRVSVSASGEVQNVGVQSESARGFGREARRCALQKRWQPARDRTGAAVAKTSVLRVNFDR